MLSDVYYFGPSNVEFNNTVYKWVVNTTGPVEDTAFVNLVTLKGYGLDDLDIDGVVDSVDLCPGTTTADSASAVIGSEGGVLYSPSGNAYMNVSPGAVSVPTTFTIGISGENKNYVNALGCVEQHFLEDSKLTPQVMCQL